MRLTKEDLVRIMSKGWYTHDGMADGILAAEAAAEKAAVQEAYERASRKAGAEQRVAVKLSDEQVHAMFFSHGMETLGGATYNPPTHKQRFEALERRVNDMENCPKLVLASAEDLSAMKDRLETRLEVLERKVECDEMHDPLIDRLEALEKRSEQTDSLRRTTSVGFSQRLDALAQQVESFQSVRWVPRTVYMDLLKRMVEFETHTHVQGAQETAPPNNY